MNDSQSTRTDSIASLIGWLILASGIAQVPAVVSCYFAARMFPAAGILFLLALAVITGLLLLIGGIGLILQRLFAYYCVYAVTFFGGIGGFKNPYIPFLKRWIHMGPATEDLFLGLNLVITAILLWEHWRLIRGLEFPRQKLHKALILGLVLVGTGWIATGQAMTHRERGQKNTAGALPIVGASFADFATSWSIPYVSVHTKLPSGITVVFSGTSSEPEVLKLADLHHLKKMEDPAAHKKFLPQAKTWKLDAITFPTAFSDDDLYFVGRLKEMPKVSFQIVYRRTDGRFTAQVFGIPR